MTVAAVIGAVLLGVIALFGRGAVLEDPVGLFNASLGGRVRRAIDIHRDDELDEDAFEDLVSAAAHHNAS